MTTYQDLLAQKDALDAKIAAARAEAKAQAVAQTRALIQEHGLTAADIFPPHGKKAASAGVAKYCDPASGNTWTGRGKPPAWIKDAADRTPFEIKPA